MAQRNKNSRRSSRKFRDDEMDEFLNYNSKAETTEYQKRELSQMKFRPNSGLKTESQKKLVRKILDNKITFIKGAAGTGKTFSSLKAALEVLMDRKQPNNETTKLYLTKPIVEAGDENMGFLPGDKNDKTAPYFSSFYSNLEKLIGVESTKRMREKYINEKVIAYERGATFDNCVAILDESQNLTIAGLKLYISRLGENAKMIILGDTDQVDLKVLKNRTSGLQDAFERFKGIEGIAYHEFSEDDIVRSEILKAIMKRYKK